MNSANPRKVASRFLTRSSIIRSAAVRGQPEGSSEEWGWETSGADNRSISENFKFEPKYLKPLASTLRSALMALGHATSAQSRFVKIKSRNISPDGSLGGSGYVEKIPEMRKKLMNVVEALSAFTDTIYDEINAPHWNKVEDDLDSQDQGEVESIVQQVEDIKQDPGSWALEEEKEEDSQFQEKNGSFRIASPRKVSLRTASLGLGQIIRQATHVTELQKKLIQASRSGNIRKSSLDSLISAQDGLSNSVDRYLRVLENAS